MSTAVPDERNLAVTLDDGVGLVVLRRPEKLNALDAGLRRALLAAMLGLGSNPSVRAVVLTGEGRSFCSGSDIDGLGRGDSRQVLLNEYRPLIEALRRLPKPVIAAVEGSAAGAGASLAFACDLIVMGQEARFDFGFIRLGLIPDAGVAWHLVRAIGRYRAAELLWSGGSVGSASAAAWGLVNRVVPAGQAREAALELAADLAHGPATAIGTAKGLLDQALTTDLSGSLVAEADAQARMRATPDHAEAMAAWTSRRQAAVRDAGHPRVERSAAARGRGPIA